MKDEAFRVAYTETRQCMARIAKNPILGDTPPGEMFSAVLTTVTLGMRDCGMSPRRALLQQLQILLEKEGDPDRLVREVAAIIGATSAPRPSGEAPS